jgi:hypothetical protein
MQNRKWIFAFIHTKKTFASIIEELECSNVYEEGVYMKEIQFYTIFILRKKT